MGDLRRTGEELTVVCEGVGRALALSGSVSHGGGRKPRPTTPSLSPPKPPPPQTPTPPIPSFTPRQPLSLTLNQPPTNDDKRMLAMAWEGHAAQLTNAEGSEEAMAGAVAGVCEAAGVDPGDWVRLTCGLCVCVVVAAGIVCECVYLEGDRQSQHIHLHHKHHNPPSFSPHPVAGIDPQAPGPRDGGSGHPPALPQAGLAGHRGRAAAPGHGGGLFGIQKERTHVPHPHKHPRSHTNTHPHTSPHTHTPNAGAGPGRADHPAAPPLRPVRYHSLAHCLCVHLCASE